MLRIVLYIFILNGVFINGYKLKTIYLDRYQPSNMTDIISISINSEVRKAERKGFEGAGLRFLFWGLHFET